MDDEVDNAITVPANWKLANNRMLSKSVNLLGIYKQYKTLRRVMLRLGRILCSTIDEERTVEELHK